jgi:hypothetical protein
MERVCVQCLISKVRNDFRDNRSKCRECEKADGRAYRKSNNKAKIWAENNKEQMQQLQSDWHQKNKPRINEKFVEKYNNDPEFKIKKNTHRRLLALIDKDDSTKKYIGIDFGFVKEWLEFCFTNEMNWENYGSHWHIDHVIPLNTFDLLIKENQLIAFNWKNLMPYKKEDNLSKHDKIIPEQIKKHTNNLKKFFKSKNLDLDKEYMKLFAKHLVAGTPLEL